MDPNDPFADLVPGGVSASSGRVGYIPGVPKAKDPLDTQSKELEIHNKQLDIAKKEKEAATTGGGTGEQGTAAGFYQRALYANQKYGKGVPPRDVFTQGVMDVLPTGVANSLTSDDRQLSATYARDFVAATLRKESGAAISEDEYKNQFVRYFPQPGDSTGTLQAKARLRDTAISSLRNQAGPAATSAEQSVAQMMAQDGQTEGGFGLKQDKNTKELSPEQAALYDAWWKANPNPSPDQLKAFGNSINVPISNAKEIIDAKKKGGGISHTLDAHDPRVQQMVDERMREGGGAGAAGVVGATDAITLGSSDELGAAGSALAGSLQGEGSFGDLYNLNVDANRGYQQALQGDHPIAYGVGQIGGSALLPTGGAATVADLAKLGAAYGGAYGFNSGEGVGDRIGGGLLGAGAGAAAGYAIPKGFQVIGGALRRTPGAVPELVDSATGALNQPLEAMRPGERVAAANQFGIDLPLDAAGGRTAAVIGKGLDIMPGSAGVMEDARRATEQQVASAADKVASGFGSSRTLSEGGAELQRGAAERIERGKGVISKAYNAIPIADAAPASNSNAVAALKELTGRFASNPELADAVRDPRLATYLSAIEKGGLSWRDLKDFRSLVGEKIGDMRFGEGHSTQDLRALYGALSEDMRNTAASISPSASRAFDRANNLNRENQNIIEGALTRILGPNGKLAPEKAAAAVQAMVKGGKSSGDLKTLAQIRAATVKSGAWDEIASTLIRLGGQPVNSAGRDFNPQTFTNWYADMAQPARNLLFGQGELRKSLDQFVAVNQRLTKVNALRNTSQTAGNMMAGSTVLALGASIANPMLGAKVLMAGAGNFGMAKVWTSPAFVRWATGMSRATSAPAAKSQIGRLSKLAATNPELREPIIGLQRQLLGAMNDNVATPLAASDSGSENQN